MIYENEMAQLRDVIERATGEDARIRLRGIAKTFEKYAHEAEVELTKDWEDHILWGIERDVKAAVDEEAKGRLLDAARRVSKYAHDILVEKVKHWTLSIVGEINIGIEHAECEETKERLRSIAREVEKYTQDIASGEERIERNRREVWTANWCANNYGGTWNIGLTPPSGWMWTLAMDGELILTPHDLSPPVITHVDVTDYCAGHPHTYAARRWCSYNYRRQWHTDLVTPKGWVWGWIEGALVLRCYDPIPPTVPRGHTNVRK